MLSGPRRMELDNGPRNVHKTEYETLCQKTELNRLFSSQGYSQRCEKVAFPREKDVARTLQLIALLREQGDDWREEKSYYFCKDCRMYHLTSRPPRPKLKPFTNP